MTIPRRLFLSLLATTPRLVAETLSPHRAEVDRLLDDASSTGQPFARTLTYRASATVTFFSIPIVSKSGVGSGYAAIEQAGQTVSIQFGAGSWPEAARGLNRLGVIHEVTVEGDNGAANECAYLAFMTSSPEKDPSAAKKALEKTGETVPYVAAQGRGHDGRFGCRVEQMTLPSSYTWRNADSVLPQIRDRIASNPCPEATETLPVSTFLHSVRRAIMNPKPQTENWLVFNGKQFYLETKKQHDPAVGATLAARKVVAGAGSVVRLDATIYDKTSRVKTPFRVWFEAGNESAPPVRFEYQARSFLKLVFEADSTAQAPQVRLAMDGAHRS